MNAYVPTVHCAINWRGWLQPES